MNSSRHSRVLAMVLSLFPGWGHVYLGRERAGLVLFTLVVASAFVMVNSLLVLSGPWRIWLSRPAAAAAILLWAVGVADIVRLTSPRRRRRIEEEKKELLRAGMIAYLKDDLEAAESAFRACLKLDSHEVEALVRLGMVLVHRSRPGRAKAYLRRARALDMEEKWIWEIERDLLKLKKKPKGTGTEVRSSESGPQASSLKPQAESATGTKTKAKTGAG
jgi:hypothetical protein